MRITGLAAILSGIARAALLAALAAPAVASDAPAADAPTALAEPALVPEAPERALDVPGDELADRAPAEPPPADFTAAQFIDSAGCVFVSTPQGWRARIARDGSPICGYPPTLSARRLGRDTVQPLFPQPAESREKMIARVLTETIVPNLQSGELVDPPPADQGGADAPSAGSAARDAAAVASAGQAAPEPSALPPSAATPLAPPPSALTPASTPPAPVAPSLTASAAPDPADPLGLVAAVTQAPVLAQDAEARGNRLCQLLGAERTPRPGPGGSSALGFCGASEGGLAKTVSRLDGARVAVADSTAPGATRGSGPRVVLTGADRGGAGNAVADRSASANGDRDTGRATGRRDDRGGPRALRGKGGDRIAGQTGAHAKAGDAKAGAPASAAKGDASLLIPPGARYVQIGAFRDAANAGRAAQRLAGMGLPVVRSAKGGTQLIMVGPLGGREAIVRTMDRVRRSGFRDAYAR